jgi:hypothetical protein
MSMQVDETTWNNGGLTVGTIGEGLDLGRLAFKTLTHKFHCAPSQYSLWVSTTPPPKIRLNTGPRLKHNILHKYPVHILLVDIPRHTHQTAYWHSWVRQCSVDEQPRWIVECWPPEWAIKEDGPLSKLNVTMWQQCQYHTDGQLIQATQYNAAVHQQRLVIRHWKDEVIPWQPPSTLPARGMQNHLRPTGIPRRCWKISPDDTCPSETDPLPERPGTLICTSKGTRQCLADEVARALGTPSSWMPWCKFGMAITLPQGFVQAVQDTTASAIWESIFSIQLTVLPMVHRPVTPTIMSPPSSIKEQQTWHWKPPDLREHQQWYQQQCKSLWMAIQTLHPLQRQNAWSDGMQALIHHRNSYDDQGPRPTHLQVLWWTFPVEHWTDLREGCSMNFKKTPKEQSHPPQQFTTEELTTFDEFVDELVTLGVLKQVPTQHVQVTAPIFFIPKTGQPGQYRVIANFKTGGQN